MNQGFQREALAVYKKTADHSRGHSTELALNHEEQPLKLNQNEIPQSHINTKNNGAQDPHPPLNSLLQDSCWIHNQYVSRSMYCKILGFRI